jgi:hypothetical protein
MRPLVLAAVVAGLAGPVLAQSLAEVAARDQERRKREGARSAPAYTDSDLRASPSPSPSASPSPASTPAPSMTVAGRPKGWKAPTSSPAPPTVQPSAAPSPEGPERIQQQEDALEAQWRAIARTRRDALAKAEAEVEALQARVTALQNDMSPNPGDLFDPNRQQKREAEIARVKAELDAARGARASAQQAVDDLERDVLRAGGTPGWVR